MTLQQQFSYHVWPEGQTPPLRFKQTATPALARQLNPRYDLPSRGISSFSDLHGHDAASAPLPCIWDPVHNDYFCYEPETTCYVYAKLGRVHYDPVKKEHYRPDAPQRLTFATAYPEYRIYQSGEVMFWDSRRQDWYKYDMHARRIIWRDQRYWPLPQRFNTPTVNSPSCSSDMSASASVETQLYDTSYTVAQQKRPKKIKPRIVEVVPGDTSTCIDVGSESSAEHETVVEPIRATKPKPSGSHTKELLVLEDVIYETPPRDRNRKHRRSRGGVYDLQDLVDKTVSKRKRYSWF